MSYTVKNFKTKKELKEAVTLLNALRLAKSKSQEAGILTVGAIITAQQGPNLARLERDLSLQTLMYPEPQNGQVSLEGPHYPEPHKWYARVEVKDGVVVRVLS